MTKIYIKPDVEMHRIEMVNMIAASPDPTPTPETDTDADIPKDVGSEGESTGEAVSKDNSWSVWDD